MSETGMTVRELSDGTLVEQSERDGSLKRFFRRLFRRTEPLGPTDSDIPQHKPPRERGYNRTTSAGSMERGIGMHGNGRFDSAVEERARIAAYRDYDAIDLEMPEAARALDVVAEASTSNSRGDDTFTVKYSSDVPDNLRLLLDDTVSRLRMQETAKKRCRSGKKVGDVFGELVVNGQFIVDIAPRSAYSMARIHDEYGRLQQYIQKTIIGSENQGITFVPGQILHARFQHEWGHRYGSSMLKSGRFLYRHLAMMQDAVVANRLTRAVQRYAIMQDIQGLTPEEADEVLDSVERRAASQSLIDENGRLDLRAKVMADQENIVLGIRTSGVGSVGVLEGSRTVGMVEDYKTIWERFIVMLPPPPAYLGIEKNVNSKATLQHEAIEYAKYIHSTQEDDLAPWDVKVLRRQAALFGYLLPPDAVQVVYAHPSILDEEVLAGVIKVKAEAAKILGVDLGLPIDFILEHVLQLKEDQIEKLMMDMAAADEDATAGTIPGVQPRGADAVGNEVFEVMRARADTQELIHALGSLVHEIDRTRK